MNAIIFHIVDNIKDNGANMLIMVSIRGSSLQTVKMPSDVPFPSQEHAFLEGPQP